MTTHQRAQKAFCDQHNQLCSELTAPGDHTHTDYLTLCSLLTTSHRLALDEATSPKQINCLTQLLTIVRHNVSTLKHHENQHRHTIPTEQIPSAYAAAEALR